MERIKAFYPSGTENILHKGRTGNTYRLDAIDQPIRIKKAMELNPKFEVVRVIGKDDKVLYKAHSPELLAAYRSGTPTELANSSGILWQKDFYTWIVNKAWTTIEASEEAVRNMRSIAITSGGHHAEFRSGYGFGPISNMIIAAKDLLDRKLVGKVAILDLDVHFANGTNSQVLNDTRILSCDIWRYKLPYWTYTPNTRNVYHKKVTNTVEYSKALSNMFAKIDLFKPDLLYVYNGLDPLSNDRMGGVVGFDEEYLYERNMRVAKFISERKIPTCILIGGGYVDYKKTDEEIRDDKVKLTKLFIDSSAVVFGL